MEIRLCLRVRVRWRLVGQTGLTRVESGVRVELESSIERVVTGSHRAIFSCSRISGLLQSSVKGRLLPTFTSRSDQRLIVLRPCSIHIKLFQLLPLALTVPSSSSSSSPFDIPALERSEICLDLSLTPRDLLTPDDTPEVWVILLLPCPIEFRWVGRVVPRMLPYRR
jgi:hypothetical protein